MLLLKLGIGQWRGSKQTRFSKEQQKSGLLTVRRAQRAEDSEKLINLAVSREEGVLSELKNCRAQN